MGFLTGKSTTGANKSFTSKSDWAEYVFRSAETGFRGPKSQEIDRNRLISQGMWPLPFAGWRPWGGQEVEARRPKQAEFGLSQALLRSQEAKRKNLARTRGGTILTGFFGVGDDEKILLGG